LVGVEEHISDPNQSRIAVVPVSLGVKRKKLKPFAGAIGPVPAIQPEVFFVINTERQVVAHKSVQVLTRP